MVLIHDANNTLKIGASLNEAQQAVILLHGRGGNAWDIAELSSALATDQTTFLVPSANQNSWYPQRFLASIESNEPYLSSALSVVHELVQNVQLAGIPLNRIALVGFSQGACLALEYVHRHPARYLFAGGLSGALIGPLDMSRELHQSLEGTPILLGCAEADRHIPLEHVKQSASLLQQQNANVTVQIQPGSAHTIFQEEMEWMNRHLKESTQEPHKSSK